MKKTGFLKAGLIAFLFSSTFTLLLCGCGGSGESRGQGTSAPPGVTTGRITGRVDNVVQIESGAARSLSRSLAAAASGFTVSISTSDATTTTDSNGNFSLSFVPAGKNTKLEITNSAGDLVAKKLIHVDIQQVTDATLNQSTTLHTMLVEKLVEELKAEVAAYQGKTEAEILPELEDFIVNMLLYAADTNGDGVISIDDFDTNGTGSVSPSEVTTAASNNSGFASAKDKVKTKKELVGIIEQIEAAILAEDLSTVSSLFSSSFTYQVDGGSSKSYSEWASLWQQAFTSYQIASVDIAVPVTGKSLNPTVVTSNGTTKVTGTDANGSAVTIAQRLSSYTFAYENGSWVVSGLNETSITAALVSINVSPASVTLDPGTKQQFTATGTLSDGTTLDLTTIADWSTSDIQIADFITSGTPGLITALNSTPYNTAYITATTGAITSNQATVVVNSSTTGSVVGTVTDANTGAAISDALVKIYRDGYVDMVLTDTNGQYAFYNVPSGTYYIIATKDNYTLVSKTVTVY